MHILGSAPRGPGAFERCSNEMLIAPERLPDENGFLTKNPRWSSTPKNSNTI